MTATMRAIRTHLLTFFLGLLAALALAAHAQNASEFQISLKAKGSIEMECSDGCAWEKLSWTCNEDDLTQECTVAFNQNGTGNQD